MNTKDGEQIKNYILTLEKTAESIIESAISLSYYMRGAISYDDMLERTPGERASIGKFVGERLDSEKDKMHPVY